MRTDTAWSVAVTTVCAASMADRAPCVDTVSGTHGQVTACVVGGAPTAVVSACYVLVTLLAALPCLTVVVADNSQPYNQEAAASSLVLRRMR